MKLNDRLKMIAEKIPNCDIVADIGTDHAYIPIYSVMNGLCKKALAVDLRKGPLEIAVKNIKKHGLEKNIETRLGNGLEPVLPEECDVVIVAGMGGNLIKDILSSSYEKPNKAKLLLLQPNNAPDALRKWLYENGFDIVSENLAYDAGKIYCLISAVSTGKSTKKDSFSYYIGEKLLNVENKKLLKAYLLKKAEELDAVIKGRLMADLNKERSFEGANEMDTAACIRIRDRLYEILKKMNQ